jgi:hypothetical protein
MPPLERRHMRDRMPGTVLRAARPLLVMALVVALVFLFFSIGVALATNDKCGAAHLNTKKEWNYFPPRWDCKSTLPGFG